MHCRAIPHNQRLGYGLNAVTHLMLKQKADGDPSAFCFKRLKPYEAA